MRRQSSERRGASFGWRRRRADGILRGSILPACLVLLGSVFLSAEARSSCAGGTGAEQTLFAATDAADAIVVAQAGPAHHGHVGTVADSELVFEMNVVHVLKDVEGEMPERFFQRGWWSWESKPLAADFTEPRTYCETPHYRVGGLYVFFLRVEDGEIWHRLSSPRARLNGEVEDLEDPLVQSIEAYLSLQRGPRAERREGIERLLARARDGGPLAALSGDLQTVLANDMLSDDWRAQIDELAQRQPAEALRQLLGRPERLWHGQVDELVARLRLDGVAATDAHLWRLPARHADWVTESLPSLLASAQRPLTLPLGAGRLARWYTERELALPRALLHQCRLPEARQSDRQTWCDVALARMGDEEVVERAVQWLEGGGRFRRNGPRAAQVLSLSPLPEAEVGLQRLLSETLERLAGLREAELPPGTRERRRRGFERILKAWVWAQLDAPLDSARARLGEFVEHLDSAPFAACTVREVLEQRPSIAESVVARLEENEHKLLEACLLHEPPSRSR